MAAYPDFYNPDLLERIPLTSRVVLDVGCGQGALGAAYRARNPRARLLGIEAEPDAAAAAAKRLDAVFTGDVEADPMPFNVPEGIDCIVYGDVLEHLREPWSVLRRHREVLHPDGTVLICVPNIEHWSFAERLLRGTWHYEPAGLLDHTHLRWFSLETMRKDLLELGFSPCDVVPRIFDPEAARAFASRIAPALAALGIDSEEYAKRAAPLQYVWRVRKRLQQRVVLSANMLKPVGGVSHVRIVHPLQAMATDAAVSTVPGANISVRQSDDDRPHIFILHRPVLKGQPGQEMIRAFLESGWLVITEFDDHPDFFGAMQDPEQLSFRGVHAVQTSTPALARILRGRNPEVAVFPNAAVSLPEPTNFAGASSLTAFFGALNREPDWQPLMPIINAIAAQSGERLKFCVVHDRQFFDALETPHKTFTPTCDYDTYMKLLGGCEISLMPLSDTAFNRAKSDLKFVEAGARRVAPLASTVVYADTMQDGVTGLLFRDPAEFRARFLRLIAMPELARELAENARRYVAENRMLAYQVAPRLAWYRSLWARREELTAALLARLDNERRPAAAE